MKNLITITAILLVGLGLFATSVTPVAAQINVLQPKGETAAGSGSNEGIRDQVEDVFGDDHIMVDVARCESSFRQFNADGDVLVNEESDAIGIFQLLEDWHAEPAEDIGLSIYTPEGNITYAKELYELDGLKPWSPSSLCWDDGEVEETNTNEWERQSSRTPVVVRSRDDDVADVYKKASESSDEPESDVDEEEILHDSEDAIISKKLIIGVDDPEVKELQKLLNDTGYELSTNGPGSPGEETSYFGSLTKQALQEFQCDQDIICSGTEYTTGYGMTDSKTRKALHEAHKSGDLSDRVRMQVRSSGDSSSFDAGSESEEDVAGASTSDNQHLADQLQEVEALIDNLAIQISQ